MSHKSELEDYRTKLNHLLDQYENGHLVDMPLSPGAFIDNILAIIAKAEVESYKKGYADCGVAALTSEHASGEERE